LNCSSDCIDLLASSTLFNPATWSWSRNFNNSCWRKLTLIRVLVYQILFCSLWFGICRYCLFFQ
jgi:hypothetical protein